MVVLFGGGDGGGFYIGPDGKIHRIPPWTPDSMAHLKAANSLLQAARLSEDISAKEISTMAQKLISKAVQTTLKGVVITDATPIAFMDVDGGFVCGSTGKPRFTFPVPSPRPHLGNPGLEFH